MIEVFREIWGGRVNLYSVVLTLAAMTFGMTAAALRVEAGATQKEIVTLSNSTAQDLPAEAAPRALQEELVTVGPVTKESALDRLEAAVKTRLGDILDGEPGHETADESEWVTVRMRVTAYCPCPKCCGKFSDGVCADGHKIGWGDKFVASDKMFGFGTEMVIPGYNSGEKVLVRDRGRVIKGNRLDVFFNSHQQAKKWGTQYLDVKVRQK